MKNVNNGINNTLYFQKTMGTQISIGSSKIISIIHLKTIKLLPLDIIKLLSKLNIKLFLNDLLTDKI